MKDKFEQLKFRSKDLIDGVTEKSKDIAPSFWALKKAYRVVIVILLVITLWMLSGIFHSKPKSSNGENAQVMVKVFNSQASERQKVLLLNAVTKASKEITIKAETEGVVTEIPVVEGQFLKKGDVIAKLDERNHQKQLEQAEAEYNRQFLSYKATKATFDQKLSSPISLAEAIARLKAAEAQLKLVKDEIDKTVSNAPTDGFVDTIFVEEGDFAAVMQSSKIATFLVLNPIEVIAHIPERNVHEAQATKEAVIILSGGKEVVGSVNFISKAADENTRTYKLQVSMPNDDYKILSGQTVKIRILLDKVLSHHIPRSALLLDIKGDISVKTVDADDKVKSIKVEIIDEDNDGFWVAGLPESVKIITLGQQYVVEEEKVKVNDKVS